MTGPDVVVKTVPGVCVDNLPLRFGSAYDASIVYDGSAEELTFQTKDAAGSLIDRVALRAGINNPSLVVNDPGADVDVRLEGDNDANLLFLDASVDRVGIGTATPGSKLTVNGSLAFTALGAAADLNAQALTNANIDSGTVDGAVIGGASPAAGTFTTLNATGGGALTGAWTNLGSVTTVDINGGTVDGAVVGAAVAASVRGTTVEGTDATEATSTTAAAMKTAGGLGVVKKSFFGDAMNVAGQTTQQTYSVRGVFRKVGIADNTAAAVVRVVSSGNGTWGAHLRVHGLTSNGGNTMASADNEYMVNRLHSNTASQLSAVQAAFTTLITNNGVAGTIASMTITAVNVDENTTDFKVTIDYDNVDVNSAGVIMEVTLLWNQFPSAPTLTAQ